MAQGKLLIACGQIVCYTGTAAAGIGLVVGDFICFFILFRRILWIRTYGLSLWT